MLKKRSLLAAIAAAAVGLIAPAGATAAIGVFVTPTPASLPAPGGNVTYTINVNGGTFDFCIDCIGGAVETLNDSLYGDLNGKGTCSVSSLAPKPIPYRCDFTVPVTGAPGTVVTDLVTAGWRSTHTSPPPPGADPTVRGTVVGAGSVSLTAPVVQNPPKKKCKKGFVLKKVKTKNGVKKKCVKKKKKQ